MKTLYSFLRTQLSLPFCLLLLCVIPITIILLLFGVSENVFILSFYVVVLYSFAQVSEQLIHYRALIAVAPIAQRTLLQHIFLFYSAVSIGIVTIYAVIAFFMQLEHLLLHCLILLAIQLALILFVKEVLYALLSSVIFGILFIVNVSAVQLPAFLFIIPIVIFVMSFFLLNRSKKWRFIA